MDLSLKIKEFTAQVSKINSSILFNKLCDNFFRYNYKLIEEKLVNPLSSPHFYLQETLEEEALNTSWFDYYQMIILSKDMNLRVLDIGSGYSKGTLLALTLGNDHFHSIEYVNERIQWAKGVATELSLKDSNFINADALSTNLEVYDIYFIYQPTGNFLSALLDKILNEKNKFIWAMESHGDLIPRLDYDNRLKDKKEILNFKSKRHDNILYSYSSCISFSNALIDFERRLYKEKYIEYSDSNSVYGDFKWVASLEATHIDYINGTPTLEINGYRINLEERFTSLKFIKNLNPFQNSFIKKKTINYKGRSERIIKVLSSPQDALELSFSGRVFID